MNGNNNANDVVVKIRGYDNPDDIVCIADADVVLPNEVKDIFTVIRQAPHGLSVRYDRDTEAFFYHVVEQLYGTDIMDLSLFICTHINQHLDSMKRHMQERPYRKHNYLSRRLLTFLLGITEREEGTPSYAWFNYAVQTFLESSERSRISTQCNNFFESVPFGNWMVRARADEDPSAHSR